MSRDFAITVREEADVVEVIKGFSREFLMSETYLPMVTHIVSAYPMIEYKQVEQNQRKQSEDEEMKEPEARESSKVRKIDLSKKSNKEHVQPKIYQMMQRKRLQRLSDVTEDLDY